jgi:hypothetical protein
MTDAEFTAELAARMNALIGEPGLQGDVSRLFQVGVPEGHLSVHSMLNSICGTATLGVEIEDGHAQVVAFRAV